MPIYNVVNKETGEKQEFQMSISSYESGEKKTQTGIKTGQQVSGAQSMDYLNKLTVSKKSCPKSKQHILKQI